MNSERDYWLAFSVFPGIGPRRFKVLLKYFNSAEEAWKAKDGIWKKIGLGPKLTGDFLRFRQEFNFDELKATLVKQSINIITLKDDSYPALLKQSEDAPFLLYIKGRILAQDAKALAIVGTRKITPYGREATEKFASSLAAHGFTVVSGLARGVDGVAHRATLNAGGRTIAVLGSGLNLIYPVEHIGLASDIIKSGGAVISEFPPGMKAIPQNFPARNRIISGLSLGVLVAEGAAKSGTKITARAALNQGREVFAVPGPITSPLSRAPADLIKLGAKLVVDVDDILEELPTVSKEPIQSRFVEKTLRCSLKSTPGVDVKREKRVVWEALIGGAREVDQIVRKTKLDASVVSSTLTMLEVSGKVKGVGGGKYMVV